MKFLLVKFLLLSLSIWMLTGCVAATDVSDEFPYNSMIGEEYIIQDSMGIYKSICWDIGDLVLTPDWDYSDCFKGQTLATVSHGDKFSIKKIIIKQAGTYGLCPQMVVAIVGVGIDSEIFIPLCSSVKSISWLDSEGYSFSRGDPIMLKEEYAVRRTQETGQLKKLDSHQLRRRK